MDSKLYVSRITKALTTAIDNARENTKGAVADYIPELTNVNEDYLAGTVALANGTTIHVGDDPKHKFTIQSVSKLITLIGLLEEFGQDKIFTYINAEPSGVSFQSVAQLERQGPIPANPMVNAGAIALAGHIPGESEEAKRNWLHSWMRKLFNADLEPDMNVYESELKTADRNRALAYLMRSTGVIQDDVERVLERYVLACSYELNIEQAAYLPMLIANGGINPEGEQIISEATSNCVLSIMATCGLYNESGMHLVKTGMPAKSAVSGLLVAVATGRGGIAVMSPRLNRKGNSIRAHMVLSEISKTLDWHFAAPWGYSPSNIEYTYHKNPEF